MTSAKRIQRLVLNKPFSAEERLLRSIRFLELSGGKLPELLPESRNMSTIALYNLDIAILAILSIISTLILLIIIGRLLLRFLSLKGFIMINTIRASFFSENSINSDKENKKNE